MVFAVSIVLTLVSSFLNGLSVFAPVLNVREKLKCSFNGFCL